MDERLQKLIRAKSGLEQRAAEVRARCTSLSGQREEAIAQLKELGVEAEGEELMKLAATELTAVKQSLETCETQAAEIEKALGQIGRE